MLKEILVPQLTLLDEPSVTLVRPGYREKYAHTKFASDIYRELENFEGKPNKSYMLVVAVSPHEYWGDNKNKDAFSEYWLKKKHPTFVENGTFFKNHVNKDPTKNYGDNEKSWYDDDMKRVLVLVGVDHKKAPDIVQDMESGKKISVSMGCRVKFDVCSICGNEAPTRAEYCDHMKYMPGEIFPDGRKVYVDNPDPTFFDLSKVIKPAGHIEYMIKKIVPKNQEKQASYLWVPRGDLSDKPYLEKAASMNSAELFDDEQDFANKFANLQKASTIYKIIQGEPIGPDDEDNKLKHVIENSKKIINLTDPEDIDDGTLNKLSECPLKNIFSTSNLFGIRFNIPEIFKIVMNKIMHGHEDMEELMHNMDQSGLDSNINFSSMFDYLKQKPTVLKIIIQSKVMDDAPENFDEKTASLLLPWVEKRSIYPYFLEKRAFVGMGPAGGALDLIPSYDSEGNQYITTRDAINRSSETALLGKMLRGAAYIPALTGSYYVAKKLPIIGGKHLVPAALAAGALGTHKLLGSQDELSIQPYTHLKKVGHLIDRYDIDNYRNKIANEMMDMTTGMVGMQPQSTPQRIWNWAQENPMLATVGGLTLGGLGYKALSGVGSALRNQFLRGGETVNANILHQMPESVNRLQELSKSQFGQRMPQGRFPKGMVPGQRTIQGQ